MALLIWKRTSVTGRGELALSLAVGALYFLYQTDREALAALLLIVLTGPFFTNRGVRAAFGVRHPVWLDIALAAGLLLSGTVGYMWPHLTVAAWAFNLLALGLFVELPLVIWRGLPDDLIEIRRQARLWILALSALLCLLMTLASIFGQSGLAAPVGAGAVLLLTMAAILFVPAAITVPIEVPELDAREQSLQRRLQSLMRTEHVFRDPNLNLSRLAQKFDVSEHRLRRIIHVGEGQRHFSLYLNALRLENIRRDFDDPSRDGDTILTLALDAGYSSLSVFNRAFRSAEGITPSAYRRARLAARTANRRATPVKTPDGTSAA